MEKEIFGVYSKEYDLTFIVEGTYNNNYATQYEVKGMYYGEPNDENNIRYYNKTVIDMEESL